MTERNSRVQLHYQGQATALDRLHGFSITGSSQTMRQQMLDDMFVLKDIAILGQWTTLYAAPNTGKTLLTLCLLSWYFFDLKCTKMIKNLNITLLLKIDY